MKKYAIVETEKSTRIFISAFTWFFLRTVPSSRNAKPACIASTITAPSSMKRTSAGVFMASWLPGLRLVEEIDEALHEALEVGELRVDEGARDLHLPVVEHGVEPRPLRARLAEVGPRLLDQLLLRAGQRFQVRMVPRELGRDPSLHLRTGERDREQRALGRAHRDVELRLLARIQ